MTKNARLDPEIAAVMNLVPVFDFTQHGAEVMRSFADQTESLLPVEGTGAHREAVSIPGLDAAPDVPGLLYRPEGDLASRERPVRPALLYLHGGGFVSGSAAFGEPRNLKLAGQHGVVVLAIDYRLAPEHPYPAALGDSLAALQWLHSQAAALGVDCERIGLIGESAGATLVASLSQRIRDEGGPHIKSVFLETPALDNRTGADLKPADLDIGEFVLSAPNLQFFWKSYLGSAQPDAPAVPARAADFAGLPPTYITSSELDLMMPETIEYAQRLSAAGVRTELHVYPAAPHGFQLFTDANVAQRAEADIIDAIGRTL